MIDRAQVRHVARLARLQLSEEEETRLAAQLDHVLGYIERLQQVNIEGIEPLSFLGDARELPLRDDVEKPCLPREDALRAAPRADEQAFLVPKVIE